MAKLKFALAQLNPTVGDFDGNVALIKNQWQQANDLGADLLVCPEMALTGYPIKDLAFSEAFHKANSQALEQLASLTQNGPGILVGALRLDQSGDTSEDKYSPSLRLRGRAYNSAYLLADGNIKAFRDKVHLPTYSVFDELRTFMPGQLKGPVAFKGVRLGFMICEDMWHQDVAETLAESGAEVLIALNGSVFAPQVVDIRQSAAVARVVETELPLIYLNLVGGQERLVFDGASFAVNKDRSLACTFPSFEPQLAVLDFDSETGQFSDGHISPPMTEPKQLYQGAVVGLRDYMAKSGFSSVLLGLSGGIDSAITAVMAVDALGADRVQAFMLPSPYTSQASLDDAAQLAKNLSIKLSSISIEPAMQAFDAMLATSFEGLGSDETEENIQSRSRGMTLMALSNKLGSLLLTTGNKSEVAVGYATLYGDMCGALNLIGDLYKTQVFELSRWRNAHHPQNVLGPGGAVMPERIIEKPPSAELKPDQTDQDSLPDYQTLDAILKGLIEDERSLHDLVAQGFSPATVQRVWQLVQRSEFKRQQAAPTIKLSNRAFGSDRQVPLINRFNPGIDG